MGMGYRYYRGHPGGTGHLVVVGEQYHDYDDRDADDRISGHERYDWRNGNDYLLLADGTYLGIVHTTSRASGGRA